MTKVTQKQKTAETTILQKLTYFFGGMFFYSIFFGILYQLIGNWGAIIALISGIICSIYLILKKRKNSRISVFCILIKLSKYLISSKYSNGYRTSLKLGKLASNFSYSINSKNILINKKIKYIFPYVLNLTFYLN